MNREFSYQQNRHPSGRTAIVLAIVAPVLLFTVTAYVYALIGGGINGGSTLHSVYGVSSSVGPLTVSPFMKPLK